MGCGSQGGEISPSNVISKISLLAFHFKKTQILWSKSPSHTAELFKALKDAQSIPGSSLQAMDPDLQKITKIGKVGNQDAENDGDESGDEDGDFDKYMPQEFLKKLPGMDADKVR